MKNNKYYLVLIPVFFLLLYHATLANNYPKSLVNINYYLDGTEIDNFSMRSLQNQFQVLVDSNLANQVKQVWNKQEVYYVRIVLENYDEDINLSVYNMLGKEVLNIQKGRPKPKDQDYYFNGNNLPNGVYICVLTGKDFKDAEKFVVSR